MVWAEEEQAELQHRANRMEGELEFRHHPEFAAPPRMAQNRSVLSAPTRARSAVSGDHFGADEIVRRQAGQAREPAEATAESQPSDAGPTDEATGHRQPVRLGGGIELAPGRAATTLGPRRASASTLTAFIGVRSIMSPSSQTAPPA